MSNNCCFLERLQCSGIFPKKRKRNRRFIITGHWKRLKSRIICGTVIFEVVLLIRLNEDERTCMRPWLAHGQDTETYRIIGQQQTNIASVYTLTFDPSSSIASIRLDFWQFVTPTDTTSVFRFILLASFTYNHRKKRKTVYLV